MMLVERLRIQVVAQLNQTINVGAGEISSSILSPKQGSRQAAVSFGARFIPLSQLARFITGMWIYVCGDWRWLVVTGLAYTNGRLGSRLGCLCPSVSNKLDKQTCEISNLISNMSLSISHSIGHQVFE